jgi:hypothetical protein
VRQFSVLVRGFLVAGLDSDVLVVCDEDLLLVVDLELVVDWAGGQALDLIVWTKPASYTLEVPGDQDVTSRGHD